MFIDKAISNLSILWKWRQSNNTKNGIGNKDFITIRGSKICCIYTEKQISDGGTINLC